MNARTAERPGELPSVEVIVVAFNSGESLAACLSVLPAAGAGLKLHVTVIDNCSSEDTGRLVRDAGISAEIVRSPVNLGYGGGNNIGIRRALARRFPPDAILILNPDVELLPSAISELYAVLQETSCGAVSPRIGDRSGASQETPRRTLWGWPLRPFRSDGRLLTRVDRLPGSCMLISTEALVCVGLFDERYFLYWEEIDLCCRLRRANQKLLIAGNVAAVHQGAEKPSLKRHRTYYTWRNQIYFSFKNYGPFLGALFVARRVLIADMREVWQYLQSGKKELVLAGLAGLWAGLRGELGPSASRFASPESPVPGL